MMAIHRVWLAEFVILFPKLKMIFDFPRVKIKKNARSQTNIPPLKDIVGMLTWHPLMPTGFFRKTKEK